VRNVHNVYIINIGTSGQLLKGKKKKKKLKIKKKTNNSIMFQIWFYFLQKWAYTQLKKNVNFNSCKPFRYYNVRILPQIKIHLSIYLLDTICLFKMFTSPYYIRGEREKMQSKKKIIKIIKTIIFIPIILMKDLLCRCTSQCLFNVIIFFFHLLAIASYAQLHCNLQKKKTETDLNVRVAKCS
jgi:hypothetical protein